MENKTENTSVVSSPRTEEVQKFNFFNPDHFATMQRIASMFANSELVPDIYKVGDKNPKEKAMANCIIAIDMANQIGANVLMVMQNLAIIQGKPSWSSKFLIGTVNTCGKYQPLKFKFESLGKIKDVEYTTFEWDANERRKVAKTNVVKGERDNIQCIAYTTPKNDPNNILESSPITLEMAIKEGWYSKYGSKWQTMMRQMLMYRAASFWTNVYAPELSLGMRTVEETQDIIDADYEDISKAPEFEADMNANKVPLDFSPNIPDPKAEEQKEEVKELAPTSPEFWENPTAILAKIEGITSLEELEKFVKENGSRLSSISGKDGELIEAVTRTKFDSFKKNGKANGKKAPF